MRVLASLKVRFVILTVIAFLVIGVGVFYISENQISAFLLENMKSTFASHVQMHAEEHFDLSSYANLKLSGNYTDYIESLKAIPGVSDIKLLGSNTQVIYSDTKTDIGQSFGSIPAVQKAIDGENVIENIDTKNKEAELYAPIKSPKGEVRGVVMASAVLSSSYLFKDSFILKLALTIGGISSLFAVIIYFLLSNSEREMHEKGRSIADKSKALEEEQQLDEAIMSSIAESLIVINKDGQIVVFNPEAERIIGHKSSNVEYRLYKKIIRFCDKEGKEIAKNPITESLNNGKKVMAGLKEDIYIKNSDNKLIPITVSVAPISGQNRIIKGVVATVQDATAEKELAKVKDEFVYVVAHELGNPIFALDGYLSILQDKAKRYDKQTKDIITSARGIDQQLSALVNDLLEVVRSQSGQLKIEVSPIDLSAIFSVVVENSKMKAATKKISINYKKANLPKVMGDEQKIREVATNLIDNAIKYTPEGGKVDVWHERKDKMVTSYVKDNGIGMDAEAQKQLFQKFFRVKTEKTKGISGTGLGLFICRQIVEKCNGKIWAESEEGKGSVFAFSLKEGK